MVSLFKWIASGLFLGLAYIASDENIIEALRSGLILLITGAFAYGWIKLWWSVYKKAQARGKRLRAEMVGEQNKLCMTPMHIHITFPAETHLVKAMAMSTPTASACPALTALWPRVEKFNRSAL